MKCLKTQLEHFKNNFYKLQAKNINLNSMTKYGLGDGTEFSDDVAVRGAGAHWTHWLGGIVSLIFY